MSIRRNRFFELTPAEMMSRRIGLIPILPTGELLAYKETYPYAHPDSRASDHPEHQPI